MPPLSPEELAVEASKFTVKTVEPLLVQVNIDVSFAFLRQAMMKIAYELAFLWLGESYLDDPLAVDLRDAILKDDVASTDLLAGYVGWASRVRPSISGLRTRRIIWPLRRSWQGPSLSRRECSISTRSRYL